MKFLIYLFLICGFGCQGLALDQPISANIFLVRESGGQDAVRIKSPALAAAYDFTLPNAACGAGTILRFSSSGVAACSTPTYPNAAGNAGGVALSDGTNIVMGAVDLADTDAVTGVLPIARGGTNKALTLSAGGIPYFDADSFEVLSAGTSGQFLTSGGSGAPTWTTSANGETTGTCTGVSNIDSCTTNQINYIRIGNRVVWSLQVTIDPTTTLTSTSWRIAIPVTSNFGSGEQANGSCTTTAELGYFRVTADAANDALLFNGTANNASSYPVTCSGGYEVI